MTLTPAFYSVSGGKPYFPKGLFGIQSHVVRYVFMQATVHLLAKAGPGVPLRILEVGSWVGASALTWLFGLDQYAGGKGTVFCCDLWEPYHPIDERRRGLIGGALPEDDPALAMEVAANAGIPFELFIYNVKVAGGGDRVVAIKARSDQALPALADASFDLVYVDGDHRMDAVRGDVAQGQRLVRPGGILCGDDFDEPLEAVDAAFARAQTEADWLRDPKSGKGFHPGVTVALADAFGSVSAYGGYWLMRKTDTGWEKVDLAGQPVRFPPHVQSEIDPEQVQKIL
ncbi:MAG: class I SAM-dependent methyltransferase [Proteobacteria bacterium]|nr:class I SAM-dependent methyltransferase [Pseudomonadota bacterium]MBI3498853.1 class I SAM-dependent methyltransferase [Pseudomonadota bacterium]